MSLASPYCGIGAGTSFHSPLPRSQCWDPRCLLANLESLGPRSNSIAVHWPRIDLLTNCYRYLGGGFEGHFLAKSYLNQHSPLDPLFISLNSGTLRCLFGGPMHSIDYVSAKQHLHFSFVCCCFIFIRFQSCESHAYLELLDQFLKITVYCLVLEQSSSCLVGYYRTINSKIVVLWVL